MKTRYVNDKQITDHYAIVPTGQGFGAMRSLSPLCMKIYEVIARRFLSIFYPAAIYQKYALGADLWPGAFLYQLPCAYRAGLFKGGRGAEAEESG